MPAGLPLILAAASFGFTIVQLDVTIVNVALDAIGREFGAPTASLQWVVDAYTLLLAALLLSAGALGDRFRAPAGLPDRPGAVRPLVGRLRPWPTTPCN